MMHRNVVIQALVICLLGLGSLLLVGCEPEPPVDKLVVQITIPEGHEGMVANWGSLRVSSTGYGAGDCVSYIPGSPAGVTVEVPPAPLGASTRVVAEAFAAVDANGQPAGACQILVSRGATPFLTIAASTPKTPMQVLMGPVGEFIRTSSAQQAGVAGGSGVIAVPTQPGQLRHGASMTSLPDGRIVIIGGSRLKPGLTDQSGAIEGRIWNQLTLSGAIEQVYETVEIYNPATGIFEVLAAEPTSPQTMAYPRMFHNAVWLESIGHIAVVGGWQQPGPGLEIQASNLIELFDPFQKVFLDASTVESLQVPRAMATTTVLDYNGGVQYLLVAGGTNASVNPAQAEGSLEIVDMSPNSLRVVSGPLDVNQGGACTVCLYGERFNHRAVMVDGCGPEQHRCVYFVGGETASGFVQKLVDVFDVKTGQLIEAPIGADAPAELAQARVDHEVVYIPAPTANQENFMYVIGGFSDTGRTSPVSLIEVISAKNGAQLAGTGFTLKTGRGDHQATRMDGDKVLVSGGLIADGAGGLAMATTSEIIGPTYPYDPLTNSWNTNIQNVLSTQTTSLLTQRFGHNTLFMDNDQLLVLGGIQKIGTSVQQVGPTTATNTPSELYVYDPSPLYEPGQ